MGKFSRFARIAEVEFSDIVLSTHHLGHKLRIYLKDKSFIDFFLTENLKITRFSLHWERRHIDKTIYRLDNTPDKKWKKVKSFPTHFHKEKYANVIPPPFNVSKKEKLETILRKFLNFAKKILNNLNNSKCQNSNDK